MAKSTPNELQSAESLLNACQSAVNLVLDAAAQVTGGGGAIDEHQVLTRRVSAWATRVEAARAFCEYVNRCAVDDAQMHAKAMAFAAETAHTLMSEVPRYLADLGLEAQSLSEIFPAGTTNTLIRDAAHESVYRKIGNALIGGSAANDARVLTESGDDHDEVDLRSTTRRFAQAEVAPQAEGIHRGDLIIPETIIKQMGELGFFGMSTPEEYGGVGLSSMMMVIATEELSAASLPAAGSLITRPEILTRALLKGGTTAQKDKWLRPVAAGELMVAVAVTEPNTGSDVAHLSCRAESTNRDGVEGFSLNGAKAWCTFAGRANILALLARTDADIAKGHKGLSLFIVEKESYTGHDFEMTQPGGGRLSGKADPTLGYRGMHSFTLQFEDFFVPASNLVGETEGVGKGFYLQMDGFAVGRLQTGGRALGLAQASLEVAVNYANERPQFGKPIGEFQNTQYEIGKMAVDIEAARQLTHAAARAMDRGAKDSNQLAAMAKLYASRVAVEVSQRAQLLHGGWGYAEEYAISRYVVDALVLPIFEGVEPILEMKVIGRALLAGRA